MASQIALALRAIQPVKRIIQLGGPPAENPARQMRKRKMAAMGIKSGKSFRRYRLALRRDYAAEAAMSD